MAAPAKPWWQQATALVSVGISGGITGFSFVPRTVPGVASPAALPARLLAMAMTAQPAASGDTALRAAMVNVARYYQRLATRLSPAQMEALIWRHDSADGADHGPSCAAFASLTLELAAQAVGQRSWVSGGSSYPWPLHSWADVRVDPNPASPGVVSLVSDAQAHHRWQPLGDGYQPRPGDWALFDGHVEVVTGATAGGLRTIGGDSLPDYSVNGHSYPAPLAAQGVTGFVNNGALASAAAGSGTPPAGAAPAAVAPVAGASAAGARTPPAARGAAHQAAPVAPPAVAAAPAAVAAGPGGADIPGVSSPAPGAFGPHRRRPRPAPVLAPIPGATPPPASVATGTPPVPAPRAAAGMAAIPGLVGSPTGAGGSPPTRQPPAARSRGRVTGAAPPGAGAGAGDGLRGGPSPAPGVPTPATPAPGPAARRGFIRAIAPGAVSAQRRYGVPASVTIAQAIDESGWGRSELAIRDHNLFGIKGSGPAGTDRQVSWEYAGGRWVQQAAWFRVYHSAAESIADHGALLAGGPGYQAAMAARHDPDAFASALTGVYATDPGYGVKLITLMRQYDLYRFDVPAPPDQATPGRPAIAPAGGATPARPASPQPSRSPSTAPAPSPAPSISPAAAAPPPPAPAAPPAPTAKAAKAARARLYRPEFPPVVRDAFMTTARVTLLRGEPLYRDVAGDAGIHWGLLAACDWMQCEARPRYSPVHGERLGSVNPDGSVYRTRSAGLARCAADLVALASAVYGIDLTAVGALSVPELADVFAAFRWGGLLRRHHTSAMEFPYSVAGLTIHHTHMRWPDIADSEAPDKPGGRFRMPFGAVPIVLGLRYPATA